MNKIYNVNWSQSALENLSNILAYPPEVKERIYLDAYKRLSYTPTLTAKQISNGTLKGTHFDKFQNGFPLYL